MVSPPGLLAPPLLIHVLLTLGLSVLTFFLTILVKPIRKLTTLAFFVASLLLLAVLGILQLDTYPFSNVLIVGFAVFGGSLFGKVVGAQRRTVAFLSILTLVSALDIASFLTGAQNASTSGPSSFQSVVTLYANFTILFGAGSHFILGSLDLLVLSFTATFFLLKGFGKWKVMSFSIVSLQLPFLYVLALQPSDGLPLIPFITACVAALLLLERVRRPDPCL